MQRPYGDTKSVKKEKLRSGYTTGACAAAAAKAAVLILLDEQYRQSNVGARRALPLQVEYIEAPFPDGSRVKFKIHKSKRIIHNSECTARASVIKDAGDDPDVTHGAEIVAEATIVRKCESAEALKERTSDLHLFRASVLIKGGEGVGVVTKPGLPVPIGEAAINPVPRKMIEEAVMEAVKEFEIHHSITPQSPLNLRGDKGGLFEITISVPNGEELAKKTLNHRLGIVGGISILGTTGIVKPVSTEAWTATISSSMDVAKAMGHKEIVVSAGRSSEKAHMKRFKLPEEVYVLMGDYLEYSLKEAGRHGFKKIHLCAQWAKMVKIAMATPQTHVRFGAIDIKKAVEFLNRHGADINMDQEFNTAREIFDYILSQRNVGARRALPLQKVCNAAKNYAEAIAGGIPVTAYLVSYEGEIITSSE